MNKSPIQRLNTPNGAEPERQFEQDWDVPVQSILSSLEKVNELYLNLEKEYYNLLPLYEKIQDEIVALRKIAAQNNMVNAEYKLKQLSRLCKRLQKNRGYHFDDFHSIFEALQRLKKQLPNEMQNSGNIERIKQKIEDGIREKLETNVLFNKQDADQVFAIVKNNDMRFLLSLKKIIWEKRVEAKGAVKIQINSLEKPNIFKFSQIPKGNNYNQIETKTAILLENRNGQTSGFLVDSYEGKVALTPRSLKKRTLFMHTGDNRYEPYLIIKGERHYIRTDFSEYI